MRKIIKNIAAISITAIITINGTMANVYGMTKGDTTDTNIKETFRGVDDVVTEERLKYNGTPVYVKNTSSVSTIYVGTVVTGTSKVSKMFPCKVGEEIFIRSYGTKGEKVFLRMNMDVKGDINGKWSPDSIGYTNILK